MILRVFNKLKPVGLGDNIPSPASLTHKKQYDTDRQILEIYIGDIDIKIPDIIGLVTKTDYSTKVTDIE